MAPQHGVRVPHLHVRGGAVQVDPMKPKLKAPGTKRLKRTFDVLVSKFAFKFNLRRYNVVTGGERIDMDLLKDAKVGRCRSPVSKN